MAKSRIGPFALESPLSAPTQSGQMFRGVHVEQRKLAAIRIFPIPLGMTPESRQAYAEQLEQLKALRHRGIVRCFGGGFDSRHAFLAYELVDGESLDKLLERRGRLSWEATIDYSKQIAEALMHAQQFAWSHGRLQPSKILVSNQGTVQVADWRRDEISNMLVSPMSREQMQMSAPEILDGQPASEKGDLYSLGAIMFFMLTGNPPFMANDAATLTAQIRLTAAPNVASQAFDCPVWLSAIVDQCLNKDPQRRPFGIAAFLLALREAERRESEGVGVLQHATAGFSPLQMNVNRSEAEKLLGIKHKEDKPPREGSIWESAWVLVAGLVVALAAVTWFMLPPSEEKLRRQAEQKLASTEWFDWNTARDVQLSEILRRFPEGQYTEWAQEKISWVNAREAERRMDRDERLGRKDSWTPVQVKYNEARNFERFGDFVSALDKFRAIQTLFADNEEAKPIIYLAGEAIERIKQSGDVNSLQTLLSNKLEQAEAAYEKAQIASAKAIWESIVELYSENQQVAPIVEKARARLEEVNQRKK
jgi:eukaryotic-like serine/threonine-protein kinase